MSIDFNQLEATSSIDLGTFEDFCKRHGTECHLWREYGCHVFADGAWYTGDLFKNMYEPPVDQPIRLQFQRGFVIAKLEFERDTRMRFEADCAMQARVARFNPSVAGPPADAVQQLEAGQQRIQQLEAQLAELDRQLGIQSP